MTKYTKAILHANGETKEFDSPKAAKNLREILDLDYIKVSESAEIGVTARASMFLELEIDSTATPLAPKPNCDNYGRCPEKKGE